MKKARKNAKAVERTFRFALEATASLSARMTLQEDCAALWSWLFLQRYPELAQSIQGADRSGQEDSASMLLTRALPHHDMIARILGPELNQSLMNMTSGQWCAAYQSFGNATLDRLGSRPTLLWGDDARKNRGVFYTPAPFADLLITHALEPTLSASRLPKVCDPTCGTGIFLLRALERMSKVNYSGDSPLQCIYGYDIDPVAVLITRLALLARGGELGVPIDAGDIGTCIQVHNSLLNDLALPDGGFDCVLGNPPFANRIERRLDDHAAKAAKTRFAMVGGAADLAYYFLALADQIANETGYVGLVLPRSLLNARSASALREHLSSTRPPHFLFVPQSGDQFAGASVYTAILVLGPPAGEAGRVQLGSDAIEVVREFLSGNWWADALGASLEASGDPLSEHFEISASMTASEAYDLLPGVIDQAEGDAPKLITTGLIEPGFTLWGKEKCRYLKSDFKHPRVKIEDVKSSASLLRRFELAKRPKILVAGLSAKPECVVDGLGEFMGAVSTYSITHPSDDLEALESLARYINSEEVAQRFVAELGANAMAGGNITMRKYFLEELPIKRTKELVETEK